jgi:hypothetical protein
MRKFKTWAASAAALLLCFSASEAFAGLSLVGTGTSQSWFMTLTANQTGGIGNVTSPFNRIVVTIGGATTYTVSAGTFSIGAPAAAGGLPVNSSGGTAGSILEDLTGGGAHRALKDGTSTTSTGGNGWTQTNPASLGSAAGLTTAELSGATVNPGSGGSETFTLFFTGNEHSVVNSTTDTHGAHFFVDFFNGSSFVTRYEIKDIITGGTTDSAGNYVGGGTQGTEITQVFVPLPKSAWAGLAMLGGMGLFLINRRRNNKLIA